MKTAYLRTEERNLYRKIDSLDSNPTFKETNIPKEYSENIPEDFTTTNLSGKSAEVTKNPKKENFSLFESVKILGSGKKVSDL